MQNPQVTHWGNVEFKANEVKIDAKVQNDSTKEIQIIMGQNGEMKEHQAPFAIHVQVLKGSIDFEVSGKNFLLQTLDMISLEPNVAHSLKARDNSIVRLSLAKHDSLERVSAVLKS